MCLKVIPATRLIWSAHSKISLHFCKGLVRKTQELVWLLRGAFCEHPSPWSGPKMVGLCLQWAA